MKKNLSILLGIVAITSLLGVTRLFSQSPFTKEKNNMFIDICLVNEDYKKLMVNVEDTSDSSLYTFATNFNFFDITLGNIYYGYGYDYKVTKIKNSINSLEIYRFDFTTIGAMFNLNYLIFDLVDDYNLETIEEINSNYEFYFYKGIEQPYDLKFTR